MLDMSEPLDLLLMPGLAFDWRGHRCGRGGGYYDKFLSLCQERAAKSHLKSPLLGERIPAPHLRCLTYETPSHASALVHLSATIDALAVMSGVMSQCSSQGPSYAASVVWSAVQWRWRSVPRWWRRFQWQRMTEVSTSLSLQMVSLQSLPLVSQLWRLDHVIT